MLRRREKPIHPLKKAQLQDTGDLEAATKTITEASKPATADYSASLTLLKPSDVRLVIKAIAARLQTTRDRWNFQ